VRVKLSIKNTSVGEKTYIRRNRLPGCGGTGHDEHSLGEFGIGSHNVEFVSVLQKILQKRLGILLYDK